MLARLWRFLSFLLFPQYSLHQAYVCAGAGAGTLRVEVAVQGQIASAEVGVGPLSWIQAAWKVSDARRTTSL